MTYDYPSSMSKTCLVSGCGKAVLAKGCCVSHYRRLSMYGTPYGKGKIGAPLKHGLHATRAYKSWAHMMWRCYNPNDISYKNYGARGVTVCQEWHDVTVFYRDMGERPVGLFLERIDNSLGYSKANCIWASRFTQNRNRRIVKLSVEKAKTIRIAYENAPRIRGKKMELIKSMAEQYSVSISCIKSVLSRRIWT